MGEKNNLNLLKIAGDACQVKCLLWFDFVHNRVRQIISGRLEWQEVRIK
jgi:hypothetical protein